VSQRVVDGEVGTADPGHRGHRHAVAEDVTVVEIEHGWKTGCTARSSRTRRKSSAVVGEGWETPGVLMVV
jgi:hypothetical protein